MRTVALIIALLFASPTAHAEPEEVERLDIVAFGIYRTNFVRKDPSGTTAHGTVGVVDDYSLVEQTDTVCARLGLSFGVEYVLVGKPEGKVVSIDWVTRFPPGGMTRPSGQHFTESRLATFKIIGDRSYRDYTFDETWEMVPGKWSLEFYHQGRKIGEKTFTVLASCPIS